MKWCEKCQMEYEDFADKCSDCGEDLIPLLKDQKVNEKSLAYHDHIEIQKVYTADTNAETDMIVLLLKGHGIPAEVRRKGMGSYLNIAAGMNYLGTDIYVSEVDYEEALALLNAEPDMEDIDYNDEVDGTSEEDTYTRDDRYYAARRRNMLRWLLILTWGLPFVLIIISKFTEWLN